MSLQHQQHHEPDDTALDALLHTHLTNELEAYVGTSAKRFEQYIGVGPEAPAKQPPRSGLRIWWTAPLLAAAAAVAMVVIPAVRLMSHQAGTPTGTATSPQPPVVAQHAPGADSRDQGDAQTVLASSDPQVQGAMWSEYRDAGRVYLDDQTVARRVVKTDYQRLQWTDPDDKSRVEITIPRQEVVLVSSPKF